jgi:hypothetical protein
LRVVELKLAMLGKTTGRLAAGTPNHWARVAPYCASAVVGMRVPRMLASFSQPRASEGKVP